VLFPRSGKNLQDWASSNPDNSAMELSLKPWSCWQLDRRKVVALLGSIPIARALGDQGDSRRSSESGQVSVVRTVVFAAGPAGGNPCPVVLSTGLTDAEMQTVARHYALDTVFMLPATVSNAEMQLRYFVPEHEMGVSGHATVAAVTVAIQMGIVRNARIRVQTKTGIFAVESRKAAMGISVTLEQNLPSFARIMIADQVAKALGIDPDDVTQHIGPIQSVSTSRPKLIVPLRNIDALRRVSPDFETLWKLCNQEKVTGLYPFAFPATNDRSRPSARQFPLRAGFPEDAATGVAAAALAAYLTRYNLHFATGVHDFQIAQGCEMGAPSEITAITECSKREITRVAIRGTAEIVSRETLNLNRL
jgi:trans-2,3-dihydro-3-hydroxyanthranilate isomerase